MMKRSQTLAEIILFFHRFVYHSISERNMMRKTVDIMVSCLIMSFILCTVIKPSISSAPQICAAESLLNNKIKKEKVAITSESSQSSQPLTQVKKLQRCRKRFRSANDDDDDWSDDSSSHYDEEIVIEKVQKNWGGVPKKFSCGMPNCQSMLYNKKSSYWHWRNMHGLTGDIFGCPDMTGVYYGCPVLECSTRYFGRFSLYKKHLCAHITKGDKIDKKYIFDECHRTPILPPDILEMVLKLKQQKKRENSV